MATGAKSVMPFIYGLTGSAFQHAAFNLRDKISYWLTFSSQSLGPILGAQMGVASDTFIMVMMLQICAQMEILIHRMQVFPEICQKEFPNNPEMEQVILSDWVQHHDSLHL